MATKNQKKKAVKQAKKMAKKYPKVFLTLVILVAIAVVAVIVLWKLGYININFGGPEQEGTTTTEVTTTPSETTSIDNTTTVTTTEKVTTSGSSEGGITEAVTYDDFQIHFMTLGNDKAGDSVYIKAGDTDILIDAGSRSGSFTTTSAYINQYCKDKKLEYVIATHGDQDHIEAFPKFSDAYTFGTIITTRYTTKTTATYTKMQTAFNTQVENGAKWYFTDDCWNNTNGASRSYTLSDNVTMDILYNYYYFDNDNDGKGDTTDENNYSVLTLFTYKDSNGNKKYFYLGGDLEVEGEREFARYYDGTTSEKTMPHVNLYKAGHHGSKTSSNDYESDKKALDKYGLTKGFLDILQPEICVVSCCCGTNEYTGITDNQFPTQQFIDRIAKWTDRVYCTSVCESFEIATAEDNGSGKSTVTGVAIGGNYIKSSGFKPLNGNVIISTDGASIGIHCSESYTKLKDSDWFNTKITIDGTERSMRTWPEY